MLLLLLSFSSDNDREKFEYLYNKYKRIMLAKAYDILKDSMLAEDAVSEAYIRIYKNLDKIDDPTTNRSLAFVVTIARNCALTLLEKRKNRDEGELDDNLADSDELETNALAGISAGHIMEVMEQLSEDLRSVFILKYSYELSHKEIGRTLGISENNVTVRLHRARKVLARLLEKEGVSL